MTRGADAFLRDIVAVMHKHGATIVATGGDDDVAFSLGGALVYSQDIQDALDRDARVAPNSPDKECGACDYFKPLAEASALGWCARHFDVMSQTSTCPYWQTREENA